MKVFDLFCGTGGFSKGLSKATGATFDIRLGIDLLKPSVETFRLNHTEAVGLCADIRKVRRSDAAEMTGVKRGELDVLIGGPPCQGFSSIRPFRSSTEDDPRNSLFEEYASFVNYFRPSIFILENVVGLATYRGGETLEVMQECFHTIGYDTDWRILNAAHFGVPQKRERFILIGVPKGTSISFPIPTHYFDGSTIGYRDGARVLRPREPDLFSDSNLPAAVTTMEAIGDLPPIKSGQSTSEYTSAPENAYQVARRKLARSLTLHEATKHGKHMLEIIRHSGKNISSIPKHLISSGFSSSYSRLDANEPSVTITVNFVHPASNRCIHPVLDRALTPREGARLQSFDDDFKFAGTHTQVVKQIGNAVPPLLGAAIGREVARML